MPVFANEVLNVGAERVGFLLGASGVGAIMGTWFIGSLKKGQPKGIMILCGAMFFGVTQICFAWAAWQGLYGVALALLFLVGIPNSLYLVGGLSALHELVPDQIRGRVMGLYGATWSLAPLGMAQAGFVAQYFGAPVAVAVGAAVVVVIAIPVWIRSADVRTLRSGMAEHSTLSRTVSSPGG